MRHIRTTQTATVVVESLTIRGTLGGADFEAVNVAEFEVEAKFTYLPPIPPVLTGPWEDADPGEAAEITITALRVAKDTQFDIDMGPEEPGMALTMRAGRDLLKNFLPAELELVEDELLGRALTGDTDAH